MQRQCLATTRVSTRSNVPGSAILRARPRTSRRDNQSHGGHKNSTQNGSPVPYLIEYLLEYSHSLSPPPIFESLAFGAHPFPLLSYHHLSPFKEVSKQNPASQGGVLSLLKNIVRHLSYLFAGCLDQTLCLVQYLCTRKPFGIDIFCNFGGLLQA